MATIAPPPIAPPSPPAEERIQFERRIRIKNWETADIAWLVGAAVSAFCLNWLLYERLTTAAGGLGFWVCWYLLFIATYYMVVRDQHGALLARDRIAAVVLTTAGLALVVPLTLIVGYTVWKGWHA